MNLNLPKKLRMRMLGDESLSKSVMPIMEVTEEIAVLAEMMFETMHEHRGIGLAANQVGINVSVIVLDAPEIDEDELAERPLSPGEELLLPLMPVALVNPEIIAYSAELDLREEGCLSIPKVYGMVRRPVTITLRAQLLNGEKFIVEVGGFLARILQHECDHLKGVVYPDRMEVEHKARIEPKLERVRAVHQSNVLKRLLKKRS